MRVIVRISNTKTHQITLTNKCVNGIWLRVDRPIWRVKVFMGCKIFGYWEILCSGQRYILKQFWKYPKSGIFHI